MSWLSENGITATPESDAGDWLSFNVPVKQASALFDAEYHVYEHKASGTKGVRTMKYSVPQELSDKIELVHPGVK